MNKRRTIIALLAIAVVLVSLIIFILTEFYLQPH